VFELTGTPAPDDFSPGHGEHSDGVEVAHAKEDITLAAPHPVLKDDFAIDDFQRVAVEHIPGIATVAIEFPVLVPRGIQQRAVLGDQTGEREFFFYASVPGHDQQLIVDNRFAAAVGGEETLLVGQGVDVAVVGSGQVVVEGAFPDPLDSGIPVDDH